MFTHDDKEFEYLVNLLVQQRDFAMGQAAALFKENAELKAQLAELNGTKQEEPPHGLSI
jgi:hypothetical protein